MIREVELPDWPRVVELHAQIEERMGQKMDLPAAFVEERRDGEKVMLRNPALLGFWVVEIKGRVEEFLYIEKALELCMGGRHARATLEAQEFFREVLVPLMVQSRARVLHCHVPGEFPDVRKPLTHTGFHATGYEHFMLGLIATGEKP